MGNTFEVESSWSYPLLLHCLYSVRFLATLLHLMSDSSCPNFLKSVGRGVVRDGIMTLSHTVRPSHESRCTCALNLIRSKCDSTNMKSAVISRLRSHLNKFQIYGSVLIRAWTSTTGSRGQGTSKCEMAS